MWSLRKTAEPMVAIAPPPIDRQAVLLQQLRDVETQLRALDCEAKEFRMRHNLRTNKFQQITGMLAKSLTARRDVEDSWRTLQRQAGILLDRRAKLLKEWSALKMESQHA